MGYKQLLEEARQNKKTKEITSQYFEFKKAGDCFVGRLLSKNKVESKLGGEGYFQYLFETDDGLIKCAFGRATDNEAGVLMQIGKVYYVEYLGTEKITGGRRINRFRIEEILEEDLEMVGGDDDVPF